jgi:hypothetical protein
MNRSATLQALLVFTLGILAASFLPNVARDARAQEAPKAAEGRFQISVIPGAVYLVDTRSGDVWVREYQTKRWATAGNPLKPQ